MMDETRDLSHVEQVIVVARFVEKGTAKVQERMLALVATHSTTGEALESFLLSVLEKCGLDVENLVGQCYDGGSNLSGVFEGVQARILEKNALAVFTHCFAHSLNRAVVNAMNHKDIPEPRNFFSILELLVVFIRAGHRLHYFLQAQSVLLKEEGGTSEDAAELLAEAEAINLTSTDENDESGDDEETPLTGQDDKVQKTSSQTKPLAPSIGISDTRWDARSSTLCRYTKPIVLRAAVRTIEHVIETTDDSSARATAIGLKRSILEPRFLLLLTAFRAVLEAVNLISKFLQEVQIDLGAAMAKVESLKSEIRLLRSEEARERAKTEASKLGLLLGVNIEEQMKATTSEKRPRKRPRRLDDRPETEVHLTPDDAFRTQHYYKAMDKLISELDKRFPNDLMDFKYLQPNNFFLAEAEEAIARLAGKYHRHLVPSKAIAEWRLFRHTGPILKGKSLQEVCSAIPDVYDDLRMLYNIFLTLPITTATLERGFSKLPLVKSRLRTTMGQPRLQS